MLVTVRCIKRDFINLNATKPPVFKLIQVTFIAHQIIETPSQAGLIRMFLLSLQCRTLQRRCFSTTAARDPLRILFCGSDNFSCASLEALHREHVSNGKLIEALDVMVLPPKWAGRGNKELREGEFPFWL